MNNIILGEENEKNTINRTLVFLIYLTGCTDDESVNAGIYNTPIFSQTTDALSYTLVADTYTSNAAYNLSFTSIHLHTH